MRGGLAADSGLAAVVAGRAVANPGPAAIVAAASAVVAACPVLDAAVAGPAVAAACPVLAAVAGFLVVSYYHPAVAAFFDPSVFLCLVVFGFVAVVPARWSICSFPPTTR